MSTRTRAALVALLAALALAGVACGGGDDEPELSLSAWAAQFCGPYDAWIQQIAQIDDGIDATTLELGVRAERLKQQSAELRNATDELGDALNAISPPAAARQYHDVVAQGIGELAGIFDGAAVELASSVTEIEQFNAEIGILSARLDDEAADALDALDADDARDVRAALGAVLSCGQVPG